MLSDTLSTTVDVEIKWIQKSLVIRKELLTMSDQTIKADAGKPRLSLVPTEVINQIARVREYGINKYPNGGPNNWKKVELDRYRDAAYRHLLAYIANPKGVDEESGLPHLAHLACNVAFLCELEALQKENSETTEAPEEEPKNKTPLDTISEEEQESLRKYLEFLTNNKETREELAQ